MEGDIVEAIDLDLKRNKTDYLKENKWYKDPNEESDEKERMEQCGTSAVTIENLNKKETTQESPVGSEHGGASKARTEMDMEISEVDGEQAKNQEDHSNYGKKELRKDFVQQENHFGPWMLVKRPYRRKEVARNNNASNAATANSANGINKKAGPPLTRSRFAALEKETEEKNIDENVNNMARDSPYEEGTKVDRKPVNVKEKTTSITGDKSVDAEIRGLEKANHMDTKVQDVENRRRMEEYQRAHNFTSDNLITQVVLPSQEIVDMVKQKAELFKKYFNKDEPPDRGSPKAMEIREVESVTMETDNMGAVRVEEEQAADSRLYPYTAIHNLRSSVQYSTSVQYSKRSRAQSCR
ncbi:hypothetical protein RIF29_07590 [Crotalaria pallida]|uniref:Uncharacterized protein n=1 Tax=Crotalaria pallida TaxID=3830 RepID=A0AAN9J566_CROPI